jgi:hypothetical protein
VVDVGVGWVSARGVWLRLYAAWIRDFEADKDHFNNAVSVGMTFSQNWGASIDYDDTGFFVPGLTLNAGNHADKQVSLNLHYNF